MRKNLFLFVACWMACTYLISCSKSLPKQEDPFHSLEEQIFRQNPSLQNDLAGYNIIGKQSFESPGRRYWLLTYLDANSQQKTIVVETIFYANNYVATKTYRCQGNSCDCRVEIYEPLPGEYNIRCACTPCTLIVE